MFERISAIIVDRLEDKRIIQMETKEVCAYGLRQIFSTILNAGTMLLIGVFMHMTIEAILFTIAYIPIRIFSGGYHASTPQRCWAFSAVMLFMVLCIVKYTPEKYSGILQHYRLSPVSLFFHCHLWRIKTNPWMRKNIMYTISGQH